MRRWKQLYAVVLVIFSGNSLIAQRVLYSPFIESRSTLHFEIAGKAGDYYWLQEERQLRPYAESRNSKMEQGFVVYDSRMNLVRTIPPSRIPDSTIKVYFICGNNYFDRLLLIASHGKTFFLLDRYTPDGVQLSGSGRIIGSLPFEEAANSFLLSRSEDQNKILMVCFQSIPSNSPRLHAILFDPNWEQIDYKKYEHPFITQPILQDDFVSYPLEHFSNSPLKLANSGQWLMISPSRMNSNYLLLNFSNTDTGFVYKEIPLPASSGTEDLALSIDNENEAAFAAVLSKFRYPALKNVEVVHYLMNKKELDFDSSYRFNTLTGAKVKNENLVQESFIAVPKKGFMLLKEYGRNDNPSVDNGTIDDPWDIESLFENHSISMSPLLPINPDGYTRYDRLGGIRPLFDRGDLNVFYFPSLPGDSCWSGIINKEQVTEFNSPYLSYFTLPVQDRLFFFYNSFFENNEQYGSTTILDDRGNLQTEAGGVFWKFNNTLNFQQTRQITINELAVPYANNRRNGFAIIRF